MWKSLLVDNVQTSNLFFLTLDFFFSVSRNERKGHE